MTEPTRNIYWHLNNGGLYTTDPPAILVIDEPKKKLRTYRNITNDSLQRLIKISLYHGAEINDGQIEVYGAIKART
jgi:hypothetical protein